MLTSRFPSFNRFVLLVTVAFCVAAVCGASSAFAAGHSAPRTAAAVRSVAVAFITDAEHGNVRALCSGTLVDLPAAHLTTHKCFSEMGEVAAAYKSLLKTESALVKQSVRYMQHGPVKFSGDHATLTTKAFNTSDVNGKQTVKWVSDKMAFVYANGYWELLL
jgi:hypothetical protein